MRCLFCKADSSGSTSIEHILPESLGNKTHTLPAGIVCDACNNYFSHSVEKPFLDAPAIRVLRFWEMLESKRGRIPSVGGVILPHMPVSVTRDAKSGATRIDISDRDAELISNCKEPRLILPITGRMPADQVISRFLAKVALEAMVARICNIPGGADYLVEETQLDVVRDHARRGRYPIWPIHMREIYRVDATVSNVNGAREQILHEWDFLQTPTNEWYFVIALLGVEFSINMGGPEIDGYQKWLQANGNDSPLYAGKNSRHERPAVIV